MVIELLGHQNSVQKMHDFVPVALRRARALNPLPNLQVMQLHQNIDNLRNAKGEAKKTAAQGLAHALLAPHKALSKASSCVKCGNRLDPGAAFCTNCGNKTKPV